MHRLAPHRYRLPSLLRATQESRGGRRPDARAFFMCLFGRPGAGRLLEARRPSRCHAGRAAAAALKLRQLQQPGGVGRILGDL
jgi:hypothetical protein